MGRLYNYIFNTKGLSSSHNGLVVNAKQLLFSVFCLVKTVQKRPDLLQKYFQRNIGLAYFLETYEKD